MTMEVEVLVDVGGYWWCWGRVAAGRLIGLFAVAGSAIPWAGGRLGSRLMAARF